MTIEEVLKKEEGQTFDRKSINIDPKALAIPIVAFANADGGDIAIGISDKTRRIEGVDFEEKKINELLKVSFEFCVPTIRVEIEKVACIDEKGRENHIIVMHIEPSMEVHANQADEVFLRVGDKSKKLSFEDRLSLMYDKGERFFEDKIVPDATIRDLDMDFVESYVKRIGYSKSALEYLKENRGFLKENKGQLQVSSAAVLLFGKNPQLFFPRARVRFIRYEGTEEKFGTEMNVIKDVIFEGNILKMINDSIAFLDTQIKEKTYLGQDGKFVTEEEYPKFVRQEVVVNAVTHRDYSIRGTDIQIKMFDDRLVVESPGKLPGLVRAENIRHTHFSRNPKIAEFLKAYSFVKEYGEGVDRMCKELDAAGLQDPKFYNNSFILQTVIYNATTEKGIKAALLEFAKAAAEIRKSAIGFEKSAIGHEKSAIQAKKLAIDAIKSAIQKRNYNEPTQRNIIKVYEEIDSNQVFSTKDITNILKCAPSTSRTIMEKLREMQVVCEVKGMGKGKYRFVNQNE